VVVALDNLHIVVAPEQRQAFFTQMVPQVDAQTCADRKMGTSLASPDQVECSACGVVQMITGYAGGHSRPAASPERRRWRSR
jgi:hypothetical protein